MNQTDALYYAHKVVTQPCGSIAPFKIGAASQRSVVRRRRRRTASNKIPNSGIVNAFIY